MNRLTRCLLAAALAGAVSIVPAAAPSGLGSPTIVYAHGHHHSSYHHSSSSTHYYYCGGHSAHVHNNGTCPYAAYTNKSTVRMVQKRLNSCGYHCGTADGVYGTKTKKALKSFQKANGLKANGVIGKATLRALGL